MGKKASGVQSLDESRNSAIIRRFYTPYFIMSEQPSSTYETCINAITEHENNPTEEATQLAIAEINRQRERIEQGQESQEACKRLFDIVKESLQARTQGGEEGDLLIGELTQLQGLLEQRENVERGEAEEPGKMEQAGATAGNFFDRTIENAKKLLEEEKRGFSERTTKQNILRYGLAALGVAATIWLWNWIRKETGKVGAAIATALLAAGAAIGINKCAQALKERRETVAREAVVQRQVPTAQESAPQVQGAPGGGGVAQTQGAVEGAETARQSVNLLRGVQTVEVSGKQYNVRIDPPVNLTVDGKRWRMEGIGSTSVNGIVKALWQNKTLNLIIAGTQTIFFVPVTGQKEVFLDEGKVAILMNHLSKERGIFTVPPDKPGEESKMQIVPA